jgi:hypothetical protein
MNMIRKLFLLCVVPVWVPLCADVVAAASLDIDKTVFAQGEPRYRFGFKGSKGVQSAKVIKIKTPNRSLVIFNGLKLNRFFIEDGGYTFAEFINKYPEGMYRYILRPGGKLLQAYIDYSDFPHTPVIKHPEEGEQVDSDREITIEWEPLQDKDLFEVFLDVGDNLGNDLFEAEWRIQKNDDGSYPTSFTLPPNLLIKGTPYGVCLLVRRNFGDTKDDNQASTKHCVRFRTN